MSLKRVCQFFGLIVMLAVGGGGAPPAAQAVITATTTALTTNARADIDPSISGSLVVWRDHQDSPAIDDIFFKSGAGPEVRLTNGDAAQGLSDVSGNIIVYSQSPGHVRAFNVATNTDLGIISGELDVHPQNPRIDGAVVAYEVGPVGNTDIWITNLNTGVMTPIAVTSDAEQASSVSGSRIVYERHQDESFVQVGLSGRGVQQTPPPSAQMADLIAFFDAGGAGGTLPGAGSGTSAAGRLGALRHMIAAAADLIAHGLIAEACDQLLDAYRRADAQPQPPDFVAGAARAELAQRIQSIRASLGCF
jgi:hypothetical protein